MLVSVLPNQPHKIGEDVSEVLDVISAMLQVLRVDSNTVERSPSAPDCRGKTQFIV